MLKLTKTGLGLLTRQYRSVLHKCWLLNLGLFALGAVLVPNEAGASMVTIIDNESHGQGEIDIRTESTLHTSNGLHIYDAITNNMVVSLYNDWRHGGTLALYREDGAILTEISPTGFVLLGSSVKADGIRASAAQGSNNLITSGGVYNELTKYYTKTAIDSTLNNYYTKLSPANDNGATINANASATTMNKAA